MKIAIYIIIILILIFFKPDYKNNRDTERIKILVRQSARWCVAARQDESLMIAVLHANYIYQKKLKKQLALIFLNLEMQLLEYKIGQQKDYQVHVININHWDM